MDEAPACIAGLPWGKSLDSHEGVYSTTAARGEAEGKPTGHLTAKVIEEGLNFFADTAVEELNVAEDNEPEFIEVEMTLDTGATVHAADREDLPGHEVVESPGSRVGQKLQAAGGKLLPNEGQTFVNMLAPDTMVELVSCFQIAKVTRPLLSVTKITEKGEVDVICKKDKALLVLAETQEVLATFHKKGGLHVAMMKVRNPRWQGFTRPGC